MTWSQENSARSDRRSQYAEKLKDPRWQKKRLKILEMDDWCCARCRDGKSNLQVHHRAYWGANPWDAPDFALETLCEKCHEKERQFKMDCDKLALLFRCMFTGYDTRIMAESIFDACKRGHSIASMGVTVLDAIESLPDLNDEQGRADRHSVSDVSEENSEGESAESDCSSPAESWVRCSD